MNHESTMDKLTTRMDEAGSNHAACPPCSPPESLGPLPRLQFARPIWQPASCSTNSSHHWVLTNELLFEPPAQHERGKRKESRNCNKNGGHRGHSRLSCWRLLGDLAHAFMETPLSHPGPSDSRMDGRVVNWGDISRDCLREARKGVQAIW